jgi:hypothetical protein
VVDSGKYKQQELKLKTTHQFKSASCTLTTKCDIIHISIWNVSFSILIGQNSVGEWLGG